MASPPFRPELRRKNWIIQQVSHLVWLLHPKVDNFRPHFSTPRFLALIQAKHRSFGRHHINPRFRLHSILRLKSHKKQRFCQSQMASFNVWGSIGKAFWLYKSGKIRESTIRTICLSHRFLRILWVDRKFE